MKTNGWPAESWVTDDAVLQARGDGRRPGRRPNSDSGWKRYRRRTICEPVSPALRRVSAFSRLLISADSPPALTVLNASRKPLVKICVWLTL